MESRYQIKIDEDVIRGGKERNELYADFLKKNYLLADKINDFILKNDYQKKNRLFDVLRNANNQNKNIFLMIVIIMIIINLFVNNKFIINLNFLIFPLIISIFFNYIRKNFAKLKINDIDYTNEIFENYHIFSNENNKNNKNILYISKLKINEFRKLYYFWIYAIKLSVSLIINVLNDYTFILIYFYFIKSFSFFKETFTFKAFYIKSLYFFDKNKIYLIIQIIFDIYIIKNKIREKKITFDSIKSVINIINMKQINKKRNANYKLILKNKKRNSKENIYLNIIKVIIKIIIVLNLFIRTTNNISDLILNHDSKITLKVKGIGNSTIFGNKTKYNFKNINYLKEVHINGIQQSSIEYKYYFNKEDNSVELILNETINNCENMFRDCSNITEINLSNFNTSQVTNMSFMFSGCSNLISINLSNLDTSQVINMSYIFYDCYSLTYIDASDFNTSQLKAMNYIFYGCTNLTSINLLNFNTSNVISMEYMFYRCLSLITLEISNFDTSKVESMSHMFYYCKKLTSTNVSNFDTSKVISMSTMFSDYSSLETIDVSNFDTSKVTSMSSMFSSCSALTILNISNFDTSKVAS